MPPMIAVVRVSAKAGHIRAVRVMEKRHDGWIRGVMTTGEEPKKSFLNREGSWYAPHNVISLHEETRSYDYNGIEPGTLVEWWSGRLGIVRERSGAWYVVVNPETGEDQQVSHEKIVPVMQTSEVHSVTQQ